MLSFNSYGEIRSEIHTNKSGEWHGKVMIWMNDYLYFDAIYKDGKCVSAKPTARTVKNNNCQLYIDGGSEIYGSQNLLNVRWVNSIAAKVKANWRYQSAEDDWSAEVYVVQDRDGNVKAVHVRNANVGNSKLAKSFMDSIERAVNKASPLPGAPDDAVFDSEIYMLFSVN